MLNIIPKGLRYDGITSVVISYYENIKEKDIQIDFLGNRIEEKFITLLASKGSRFHKVCNKQKNPLKYLIEIYKIIKENSYDIVHIHGSSTLLCLELFAAQKANCNIRVVQSHNTTTEHTILNMLCRLPFEKLYTTATACGKDAAKWLFKEKPCIIIPNARDLSQYKYDNKIRNAIRDRYNLQDYRVIGCVGSLNNQKNHTFLLRTFKKITDAAPNEYKLILIGDGKLKIKIKNIIKKLKLENSVLLIGKTNNVNEWLNAMDVFALASKYEGFPTVLVESQTNGLPSIVSNKVTKEIELTDLIKFLPINLGTEIWAKQILDIKYQNNKRGKYYLEMKEKGYDIKTSAKKIVELYRRKYDEQNIQ